MNVYEGGTAAESTVALFYGANSNDKHLDKFHLTSFNSRSKQVSHFSQLITTTNDIR